MKSDALNRLSKLVAHEVSLVKRGANKKPFVVVKSEKGVPMPQPEAKNPYILTGKQSKREDAFIQSCLSQVQKSDIDPRMLERAQAGLRAAYRILEPYKEVLSNEDFEQLAQTVGVGQDEGEDAPTDSDDVVVSDEPIEQSANSDRKEETMAKAAEDSDKSEFTKSDDVDTKDHELAMKAAKEAYKKALGQTAKAADNQSEESDEKGDSVTKSADIKDSSAWKNLPEPVRAHFESVAKSAEDEKRRWIEKSAGLEARVRKMEDEKQLSGFETIVKSELSGLSLDVEKTCKVMKSLADVSPEALDGYLNNLRSLNEQVRVNKSFNEVGGLYGSSYRSTGEAPRSSDGMSAEQRFDAAVKKFHQSQVSKADGKPMSEADAYAAFAKTDEGLSMYTQLCNERGH